MASPTRARAQQATGGSDRAAVWLRAAVIVVAGVIAYANGLSGPFVLDDEESIVLNEQMRQLWPPSVVLFPAKELPVAGRPVVNVSFALNYAFGGLEVEGYHVVNVAIHIICALFLFGVVRRTLDLPGLRERFGGVWAANLGFASALIWLVHPLQTDAVDYVTQRTELLMGLFFLLTFYASIRGRQHGGWLVVAAVACLLGTGSKESMATAPVLVVLYDRIFLFATSKEAWRRRWPFYLALAASWILLAALMWSGPRSRSAGFATSVSSWAYLLNQTVMIVHYLRLAIWPDGFVILYGVPRQIGLGDVLPYAALLVTLGALTMWALVVKPRVGFLGAWFFVTLAPASSIVPIATEVGAERRMYLPLAAIVVSFVLAAAVLWQRRRGSRAERSLSREKGEAPRATFDRAAVLGFGALAVVSLALMAATIARNRQYASTLSLARTTMARWPNARAEHWLGIELIAAKQREEGLAVLRHALTEDPSAHYTLGVTLYQDGKLDEALAHLREFLAHESLRIEVPSAHETIGRVLATQGKFAEAAGEFRQVLRMTPSNRDVLALLAESLLNQEKYDEAASTYQQFLRYRPSDVGALMNLGIACAALGRDDEAVAAFRRAVEIDPRNGGARRNLARALITKRVFDEAEQHAREAVLLRPDDPVAHDELGLALAGQQKLDEAILELRRSLQLDPNDEEVRTHLAAVIRAKDGIMRLQ